VYFDGWGWEVYGQYQLADRIWFTGGWNYLKPDGDQDQAGEYRVKYGVLGMRYTFDEFRRMVYFNVRLNDGRTQLGESIDNAYTLGVRWAFP
jgi:hypothetical protein